MARQEVVALAKAMGAAQKAWAQAALDGIQHILIVARNNPTQSLDELLKRKDVAAAMVYATSGAAKLAQFQILKQWAAAGGDPKSPYLGNLLSDAAKNGDSFRTQMTPLLEDQDYKALKVLVSKIGLRAAAGQSVAESRASNEKRLADLAGAGVTHGVWRTTSDNPCATCVALDGTVVELGNEFDASAGPGDMNVYDDLVCPPRHVNCLCVLEKTEEAANA